VTLLLKLGYHTVSDLTSSVKLLELETLDVLFDHLKPFIVCVDQHPVELRHVEGYQDVPGQLLKGLVKIGVLLQVVEQPPYRSFKCGKTYPVALN